MHDRQCFFHESNPLNGQINGNYIASRYRVTGTQRTILNSYPGILAKLQADDRVDAVELKKSMNNEWTEKAEAKIGFRASLATPISMS